MEASGIFAIDRSWLVGQQFGGFLTVAQLIAAALRPVPDVPGVYAVMRESSAPPQFLDRSNGGHFKRRDPSVPLAMLAARWLPTSRVLYLGKAGFPDRGPTLRKRLRQYLAFGQGKAAAHRGGRLIWQIADSSSLLVAWRPTAGMSPRSLEAELLAQFEAATGRLPFANLTR